MGKDGRGHRVGAQVLIAFGLELMAEVHDPGSQSSDLERHVDGFLAGCIHADA